MRSIVVAVVAYVLLVFLADLGKMKLGRVSPVFAWYDLWVGIFWARESRKLYIFPIPMFGISVCFRRKKVAK